MPLLDQLAAWIPGQWDKAIIKALLVGTALLAFQRWMSLPLRDAGAALQSDVARHVMRALAPSTEMPHL